VAESEFVRAWRSGLQPCGSDASVGNGTDTNADAGASPKADADADAAAASGPARPTLAEYAHRLQRLKQPGWPAALAHPSTSNTNAGPALAAAPQTPATEAPTLPRRPASASPDTASAIGTLVHRYLELIAHDGPEAWPSTRLPPLHGAMQQSLRAQGLSAPEATAAANRVQRHLHTTLSSADGRWLLSAHTDAASECAIGSVVHLTPVPPPAPAFEPGPEPGNEQPPSSGHSPHPLHVIDRTFVHQGRRWIVDYKTTEHEPSAQRNGDLDTWRAQLQRYRALHDDALPVQLAVFLTHSGRLLRLSENQESNPVMPDCLSASEPPNAR